MRCVPFTALPIADDGIEFVVWRANGKNLAILDVDDLINSTVYDGLHHGKDQPPLE